MNPANQEMAMKMRSSYAVAAILAFGLVTTPLIAADDASTGSAGGGEAKSTRPPTNLKKMPDGHWTPWDPPPVPEGSNVHVVVQGDTLWALAQKYLNNPYLWPQIWDQNRYVLDSHWIYPGDPILVNPPEVVPENPQAAGTTPGMGEGEEEEEEGEEQEARMPPPPPREYPLGDHRDLYCSTIIQEEKSMGAPAIVAAEDDKIGLGQGDVVYIDAGSADGIRAGDTLEILRDRGAIKHPATRKRLGYRFDRMGEVTVLCVQERTATVEITMSCEEVLRGDLVAPYPNLTVPTHAEPFPTHVSQCDPGSPGKPTGFVVASREEQIGLGQGNVVSVDLGAGTGVRPGDMVLIYRPNREGKDLPRTHLGDGVVLLADDLSSVVKITAANSDIFVGDEVELR
jgi:hypothetical protein